MTKQEIKRLKEKGYTMSQIQRIVANRRHNDKIDKLIDDAATSENFHQLQVCLIETLRLLKLPVTA